MKENSMSFETAKQEVEKIIAKIEERSITHRTFSEECLRKVLFVLLTENQLAKEALKKQCDIADERNQLLIENQKLQKEKEELKHKYDIFVKMNSEVIENSISKQKIKDEIEYINKFEEDLYKKENIIQVLQDLLEEKGE